jgi:hypothetical protein
LISARAAATLRRCFPRLSGGSTPRIVDLASSGKQANHVDAQTRLARWSPSHFLVFHCECGARRARVRWTRCGLRRAGDRRGLRSQRRGRPIDNLPEWPAAMAALRNGISLGTSPPRWCLHVFSSFALAAFSTPPMLAITTLFSLSPQSAEPRLRPCRIGKIRPFSAEPNALSWVKETVGTGTIRYARNHFIDRDRLCRRR